MILFLPLAPDDGSSASDCLSNFATTDAIMAGLGRSVSSRSSQREHGLIPEITFTCHGFITKWILAANWDDEDCYHELQTWNSIDGITYTKQGATTFSAEGGSEEMTFYEYTPDIPQEFHAGDVLGIFIPDWPYFQIFTEEVDSGPLNYFFDTGSATTSQFNIAGKDVRIAAPLIAVEICE